MTSTRTIEIACPRCHVTDSAEIWTSVNAREDPDAAQWLIDGFLFEHTCGSCGNVMMLNHDCLYHDPDRKVLVQLVAAPARMNEAKEALQPYVQRGYEARVVGSRYALREKAAIVRDGLDDHAVELLKFLVFNRFVGEGGLHSSAVAYYGARTEDGAIVIEFVGDGEPRETEVPADLYASAAGQLEGLVLEDADPLCVDRAWAAHAYEAISA